MLESTINNFNKYLTAIIKQSQYTIKSPQVDWWNSKLQYYKDKINALRKQKSKSKDSIKIFYIHNILKELNNQYKHEVARARLQQWKDLVNHSRAWGRPYKMIDQKRNLFARPKSVAQQIKIKNFYSLKKIKTVKLLPISLFRLFLGRSVGKYTVSAAGKQF